MKIGIALVSMFLLSQYASAKEISVQVNGMVCSFCAQGIEKSFSKLPEVSSIKVSLETKLVSLNTKDDKDLDDSKIKELITDAGYEVVKIERKNEQNK
ncbi:MAG: heavy-metal-associated domain-containing protein [Oligoflexia bacterium]|nr:heavy-metal-associated domain-containing protein [Oligoflexia bacterium]